MVAIKRDESNTKVTNREEVIEFVNGSYQLLLLEDYLSQLINQTKVDMSEVESIIESLKNRIARIKPFIDDYKNSKEDSNQLALFYETNIEFINELIDIYQNQEGKNKLDKSAMKIIVDFLRFCLNKLRNNEINYRKTQEAFEKFFENYNNIIDPEYNKLLKEIYTAYKEILNKTDETAMEYKEKDYQTLSLINNPHNGYKLTEDDENITKLDKAAFITTAIVLQGTLVLGLIISLLALVK